MRVGYIGLGNMGKPMASHLAPAGFETTVFDLVPDSVEALVKTGARAGASVLEVAAASDVLCLCVPADEHVRAVLLGDGASGALDELAPGGVVVIHSTVRPETVEEMHAMALQRGCTVIDASVTGGERGARAGELIFLVGGDDAAVEKVRPVLDASSKLVIHAGPRCAGAKLKLAVNLLTYVHWAAVREAFGLAEVAGIDSKHLIEATRANGQLSDMEMQFVPEAALPQEMILPDDRQDALRVQLFNAEKDLAHALELARAAGLALPTAAAVSQGMARIYRVEDRRRR
ncbi:MAG: 6-phosphogluconate dehydrogenase [Deltaproteobacteria bacterium]|jgi:3-hydroxyisobutyrate dehydrogenase-like beta-hydroxyacid dehydrogenase|nr:6-phosphogluconate dehydrogenase [Deltaproteobacteria bacterium]